MIKDDETEEMNTVKLTYSEVETLCGFLAEKLEERNDLPDELQSIYEKVANIVGGTE